MQQYFQNPTVVIYIYSVPLINRFFGAPVIIVLPIIASGVVIELYKYFSVVCINGFCVAIDNVIVINNHVGSVVARQLVWAELECIVPGISNREQLCAIAIYGWLFVITTITDADIGITSLLPQHCLQNHIIAPIDRFGISAGLNPGNIELATSGNECALLLCIVVVGTIKVAFATLQILKCERKISAVSDSFIIAYNVHGRWIFRDEYSYTISGCHG